MALTWRAALLTAVVSFVMANGAGATTKPPLKRACQLVTTAQVSAIMGITMHRSANDPNGCGWRASRTSYAGLELYGFKRLSDAKDYLASEVQDFELCGERPPDQFLPRSGLGDDAWIDACNSNVAFRVGHVTGRVTSTRDGSREGSRADAHRTAAITRKAVAKLRRLRCPPSFCS